MIESITIHNFQKHKILKLDLDPFVTTIVGWNDKGKSAIIRALKWVAFNEPAGTSFIHHGTKRASVLIRVDGHAIKRVRSKGKNIYQLNGDTFKAFGNGVPFDVGELLNLTDVNFQNQHDAPFWFSLSAGQVSRQLNQIIDLSIIDKTLGELASNLREAVAEEKVLQKRERVSRQIHKDTAKAVDIDKSLQAVELLSRNHEKIVGRRSLLNELIRLCTTACRKRDRLGGAILAATGGIREGAAWAACLKRRRLLTSLIGDAKRESQTAHRPVPDISPLESKYKTWDWHNAQVQVLSQLVKDCKTWAKDLKTWNQTLKESQRKLKKEIGKVCPLCEQTIQS